MAGVPQTNGHSDSRPSRPKDDAPLPAPLAGAPPRPRARARPTVGLGVITGSLRGLKWHYYGTEHEGVTCKYWWPQRDPPVRRVLITCPSQGSRRRQITAPG